MVNTVSVDGVFVEDYKKFTANYYANIQPILPPQATLEKLEDDGGCVCVFQKMRPAVPFVADRVLIVSYYHKSEGDDYTFMVSSRGNKHLLDLHKAKYTADEVIATLDVNSVHFTPKFDSCGDICGTEIKQLVMSNPNGDLIDALKTKLVAFQAQVILDITNEIRKTK